MFHVKHFDTRFWDCGVKHLVGLGVKHFFGVGDVLERGDVLGRGGCVSGAGGFPRGILLREQVWGLGMGRVGDNAHPCAVSPKTAIRGRFSLDYCLLPK